MDPKEQIIANFTPGSFRIVDGIYDFLREELRTTAWDQHYLAKLTPEAYAGEEQHYIKYYLADTLKQLSEAKKFTKTLIYLEIGCGPFYVGKHIAKEVGLVIGVDNSLGILLAAKAALDFSGITNYLLLRADIQNLPIAAATIDIIYGGGVIEHVSDTQKCITECYRVLRTGGVSVNTVPMLNIGSLTYRQLWGNIPEFPVLKQIAEVVHMKLLKGKHMKFGYEKSFTAGSLSRMHKRAGFSNVSVSRFEVQTLFEFLPHRLQDSFRYLAEHSPLFWPMLKVVGEK